MAQGVGSSKQVRFGKDTFGGTLFGATDYSGPTSYVQGGDAIDPKQFGFQSTIVILWGTVDHSNTYEVVALPIQNNITQWRLVWQVLATGLEVGAEVNLSGATVRLAAIGV